jgi:hypothetical protein
MIVVKSFHCLYPEQYYRSRGTPNRVLNNQLQLNEDITSVLQGTSTTSVAFSETWLRLQRRNRAQFRNQSTRDVANEHDEKNLEGQKNVSNRSGGRSRHADGYLSP